MGNLKIGLMDGHQRISVAMCTYNGEKYLREQLASIAAQARLPDELVVCDDRSTDSTPELVEEYARSVPFTVRFFRNPQNLGSTRNFEQAIALCEGDFIAFCDQDDIWLPEKLARQADMLERDSSLGGVFSDAELIDATSLRLGRHLWANVEFTPREQKRFQAGHGVDILLKRNVVTGATLMIRASLRPLFLPIPASWVHDAWISMLTVLYSELRLMELPLVRYRIHEKQQLGIENFYLSHQPTFWERLEKGKREESGKQLKHAGELEELEQRLVLRDDARARAVLPALRGKIHFFKDRSKPYSNRFARVVSILRNTAEYHRYERGWKCLVRDVLLVFV